MSITADARSSTNGGLCCYARWVGSSTALQFLDLAVNHLGEGEGPEMDVLLAAIAKCSSVTHLDLSGNRLTATRGLAELRGCTAYGPPPYRAMALLPDVRYRARVF